jgi:Tfp pilus assembly protein FimV
MRRAALLAVLATLLGAAVLVASVAPRGVAAGGQRVPAGGAASTVGGSGAYVVAPGDTWWSIAEATAPHLDVRVAVDRLVERNGRPLVPGRLVELPPVDLP